MTIAEMIQHLKDAAVRTPSGVNAEVMIDSDTGDLVIYSANPRDVIVVCGFDTWGDDE